MTHHINIGAALSKIIIADAYENAMHEAVANFCAPSECHGLVSRGAAQRKRRARRHAEAIARAPMRVIWREAERRIGSKALRRAMIEAEHRATMRNSPFA